MLQSISQSLAVQHPLLSQSNGPNGEHYPYTEGSRFPRIDSVGDCWIPEGYNPDQDSPDQDELWINYEDSVSQIMRAECDLQDWMEVCTTPLYWEQVACDIYTAQEETTPTTQEEESSPGLSGWIVYPVLFLSWLWEFQIVAILLLPWYAILFSIAVIDWILDFVFMWTIGLICVPCAGIFIWIINLVHLPFTLWGFIYRVLLETFGLIVDGWLLLFNFSGCYIFIGRHCNRADSWLDWLDIPVYTKDPVEEGENRYISALKNIFVPPALSDADDIRAVRKANREPLLDMIPAVKFLIHGMDALVDNFAL